VRRRALGNDTPRAALRIEIIHVDRTRERLANREAAVAVESSVSLLQIDRVGRLAAP
jgi:hypothetical protein